MVSATVLVVEYGDFDNTWNVALPNNAVFINTADIFNVTSVAQPGLGNRTFALPIGAVVGGGSAVNGMAWDRGAAADYDAWEKLGNPGWGWAGLFPYFKKVSHSSVCRQDGIMEKREDKEGRKTKTSSSRQRSLHHRRCTSLCTTTRGRPMITEPGRSKLASRGGSGQITVSAASQELLREPGIRA